MACAASSHSSIHSLLTFDSYVVSSERCDGVDKLASTIFALCVVISSSSSPSILNFFSLMRVFFLYLHIKSSIIHRVRILFSPLFSIYFRSFCLCQSSLTDFATVSCLLNKYSVNDTKKIYIKLVRVKRPRGCQKKH